MTSVVVVSCLIFQTAVAIYLLQISLLADDFEKDLQKLIVIILIHLCTNFFLQSILHYSATFGNLATGFSLLYGPFVFIVGRSLVGKPLNRHQKRVQLSPFFIFSVIYILFILGNLSGLVPATFISGYANFYRWIVLVPLISYLFVTNRLLFQYKDAKAVNADKRKLINNIALVFMLGTLSNVVVPVIQSYSIATAGDFDWRLLSFGCFAFVPVLILRYKLVRKGMAPDSAEEDNGVQDDSAATRIPLAVKPEKRYQKSGMDEGMIVAYEQKLKLFIEKSKIYLNAELSLDELANQTSIPKHHITQLLNDKLHKNFYSFINEYRIRESMKLLEDKTKDINILSLAYDCGFNSKSSFNSYFKKITNCTPSAYRKRVSSKRVPA